MKKLLSLILLLALVLCAVPAASAEEPTPIMEVFNCSEYVSLREYPDTKSKVLNKVYKGDLVYFYAEPDGNDAGFYQVEFDGKVGYILSKYLKGTDINKNSQIMPNQQLCNCTDGVYLRAEPDDNAAHLAKVPVGAIVTRCVDGNGLWVMCSYRGKIGYIKSKYLRYADYEKIKREEKKKNYPKEQIDVMQVVNVKDWLALREGPGTSYKLITTMTPGSYVTDCLYVNADWVHVTYEGQSGYAYSDYLVKAELPVEKHPGFSELKSLPAYKAFMKVGDLVCEATLGKYHVAVRRAYTDNTEQLLAVGYDFVDKPCWRAFEEIETIGPVDGTAAFIAGTEENPYLVLFSSATGFTARAIDEKGTVLWTNDCQNQGTAIENALPGSGLIAAVASDGTIIAAGCADDAPIAIDVNGNLLWRGINPDPQFIYHPIAVTPSKAGITVLYDSCVNEEGMVYSVTYDFETGVGLSFEKVSAPVVTEPALG